MKNKKPQAKKRRARGTGTIFYNKRRGLWVGRVPIGKNTDRTTKYAECSDPKQQDAIEKMKLIGPPGPETTLGEWATRWLSDLGLRDGTNDNYSNSVVKYITPTLGHIRICELTTHQIESASRKWSSSLAANTVRLTLAHLHACLNCAVRAEVISRNPASRCRKPSGVKKDIDPFTVEELARIVEESAKRPNLRFLSILASVGCRVGECLALDAKDWNPMTCTISITKTLGRKKRSLGPPKSKHSTRTIRVPKNAVPVVNLSVRKTGPLFPTARGNRSTYPLARRAWYSMLVRMGIRPRNLHQLRHSVATHQIAAGVPIGNVAQYLGDTPDTIVKTYLHPTKVDPADAMDRLFDSTTKALRCT